MCRKKTIEGLQESDYGNLFEEVYTFKTSGFWIQAKETDFALLKQKRHFLEG